ncbi:energy-coupling factor transporter ATPase [Ornithinibacillus massiliensis]|uniref:ABC transporter ATP-binding protein n=1 Tax=Ornithinibacillus massiliensis TaxID=1944633 RepID=UPI0031BB2904
MKNVNHKPYNETIQPLIQVNNFSLWYENNESPVLNNLTFSIYSNQIALLMGTSGSGKSSLALCLNGIYPEAVEGISSGDIYFEGNHITNYAKGELSQNIGIVFQDPESQFCMLTVEDELAFTLENRKVPSKEMPDRIKKILQLMKMESYMKRELQELSGGEKQKIALAAVLLLEPKLIILDEPTANLDPISSLEFINLVHQIKQETNTAFFIIDHQSDDWLPILHRLLVLGKNGTLMANGKPNEIFQDTIMEKEGIFLPKKYQEPYPFDKRLIKQEQRIIYSFEHVSFNYKGIGVLHDINLELFQGEMVAIVGQNGAGKSTLLQLMSGLLIPDSGEVTFYNKPLGAWKENELRSKIGFVFQNPEHQFITDTVYDETSFSMRLNGISDELINHNVLKLLDQFNLTHLQHANPFSLSGGQKRRLSVATMLDEEPSLLLLDEPTFGQDAHNTREMLAILLQLLESGTSIVMITHDMDLADFADRILVLDQQRLCFSGTPDELWMQQDIISKARLRLPYRMEKQCRVGEQHDFVY